MVIRIPNLFKYLGTILIGEKAVQMLKRPEEATDCIISNEEAKKKEKLAEKKEKLAPFEGTWKPIYSRAVNNNLFYIFPKEKKIYAEELNIDENDETIIPIDETTIKVNKYGLGGLRLIEDQGNSKLVSRGGVFVRKSEYDAIIKKMFVRIELSEKNISEYIDKPVRIGTYTNEWGDKTDIDAYALSSSAYTKKGLIMLSFKDVRFEAYFSYIDNDKKVSKSFIYDEPYSLCITPRKDRIIFDGFGKAQGIIWYIRKEYTNISEGSKSFTRKIEFTDDFCVELYARNTQNVIVDVKQDDF